MLPEKPAYYGFRRLLQGLAWLFVGLRVEVKGSGIRVGLFQVPGLVFECTVTRV